MLSRIFITSLCISLISIAISAQSPNGEKPSNNTPKDSIFVKPILLDADLLLPKQASTRLRDTKDKRNETREHFISSTGGWGGNFTTSPSAEWDFVFGKNVNERLSLGLGFAISLNSMTINGVENHHFIPVFAYSRYYLNDKKIKLFAYTRIGHGFSTFIISSDDHSGGFHFQPGLGLRFPTGKTGYFLLTIGQNIQHTKIDITSFDASLDPILLQHSRWYNRPVLKIGVLFDTFIKDAVY